MNINDTDSFVRVLIDSVPFAVHIWDKDLRIVDCNQASVTLFRVSDKQEYLENFYDFSPEYQPDGSLSKEASVRYIKKAFSKGTQRVNWTYKASDGELIPSETTFVRVDYGSDCFVAAYVYDMTEIKKTLTELEVRTIKMKEAKSAAKAASHAKGEFLANMSYEIRTLMNAIIGMTNIGKAATDMERMTYSFTKIEDASKHLLGVINDILEMSRIEAGRVELTPVEFDFEQLLSRIVNVVSLRAQESEQKLSIYIDNAIPVFLIGDERRLAQVITNLLGNAVKFTPEYGTISLNAYFMGEKNGVCKIKISVEDTGIGISREQQARLFQAFQQAESSASRKSGGAGLGLVISKSIVELMGGKIEVESETGKGSKFTFTVKMKRGQEKPKVLPEDTGSNINGIFDGRRVLVAEDVEINREIIQALLEPTKIMMDFALNGVEAVQMFTQAPGKYDMIFMDVLMPEMDGLEATRTIRALGIPEAKTIPIVAITANVLKEDIEKCFESGMNGHVGKPVDLNDVISQLRMYV